MSAQFDAAALAARERNRWRLAQPCDVEFFQRPVEIALAPLGIGLDHFEHGADVLLDGEATEDRGFLRQIADTKARPLVHRQSRDVVAVKLNTAFVGLDEAGHHVKDGGFAGAIGAEEANRFAFAHVKTDAFDHLAPNEAFLDAMDGKYAFAIHRRGTVAVGAGGAPGLAVVYSRAPVGPAEPYPGPVAARGADAAEQGYALSSY